MKAICVKCNREMVKEIAGVLVGFLYLKNTAIYKLWYADFYRCPICQIEIIHDFAERPFWECHEKERDNQKVFAIEEAKRQGIYHEILEA